MNSKSTVTVHHWYQREREGYVQREEIMKSKMSTLQRICIKTISISLYLEPFLKTLFKENVPRREKKLQYSLAVGLQGHCRCLPAWRYPWVQCFLTSQGPEVEDEQLLEAN